MYYNTNECGCSLFNTLFGLTRNGCMCCPCNGWNGWGNWNRTCGCRTWNNGGTTVTTNGNGCGYSQFFSIPVSGRIILHTGNVGRTGCGCNCGSTFDNFDGYYARQYGLTSYGNTGRCGCSD